HRAAGRERAPADVPVPVARVRGGPPGRRAHGRPRGARVRARGPRARRDHVVGAARRATARPGRTGPAAHPPADRRAHPPAALSAARVNGVGRACAVRPRRTGSHAGPRAWHDRPVASESSTPPRRFCPRPGERWTPTAAVVATPRPRATTWRWGVTDDVGPVAPPGDPRGPRDHGGDGLLRRAGVLLHGRG